MFPFAGPAADAWPARRTFGGAAVTVPGAEPALGQHTSMTVAATCGRGPLVDMLLVLNEWSDGPLSAPGARWRGPTASVPLHSAGLKHHRSAPRTVTGKSFAAGL